MPSDRKKKAAAAKSAKGKGKSTDDLGALADQVEDLELAADAAERSCTGVLTSHPQSRDVQMESFTLLYHGHDLLVDTKLELNYGRRYGLIGPNGCGKSCMLRAIAARDVPVPEHIDIYLLDRECPATDMTALEMVKLVDKEKARLEAEGGAVAVQIPIPFICFSL